MHDLKIVEILAVPGLALDRDAAPAALLAPPTGMCSVGLVLSDGHVAWGDCIPAPRVNPMLPARAFLPPEGVNTLKTVVRAHLVGRRVSDFAAASAEVDVLTEKAAVTRKVPASAASRPPAPLTRRELLTGKFNRPAPALAPRSVTVEVEQLIHPALRYGLSQALLAAAAHVAGQTVLGFLVSHYDQTWPEEPVPLLGETHGEPAISAKAIDLRLEALGYRVPGFDPMVELGSRLDDWLIDTVSVARDRVWPDGEPYRPMLHLAVNGGFGQLHANRPELIMAELIDLQAKCGDHPLFIETPFLAGRLPAQVNLFATLSDLIRRRGLILKVGAGAWVNGLSDLDALLAAAGMEGVTLTPARFGGLHQTIAALQRCQAADRPALLAGVPGETPRSARFLTTLALVFRPALLTGMPDLGAANGAILTKNDMAAALVEPGPAAREGQV